MVMCGLRLHRSAAPSRCTGAQRRFALPCKTGVRSGSWEWDRLTHIKRRASSRLRIDFVCAGTSDCAGRALDFEKLEQHCGP